MKFPHFFSFKRPITLDDVFDRDNFPSRKSHWILWSFFSFTTVFLIWAHFAVLDEVTVATGKVIPSSQVQVIQNLEGGIIKEMAVSEGQMVNENQVVAYLDNTRFQSSYQEGSTRGIALKIKMARLSAEAYRKPLLIPKEFSTVLPTLAENEQALYDSHIKEIKKVETSLGLISKELQMTKPLVAFGAASEVEVLRLERQINELQNQLDAFRSKTLDELNRVSADAAALDNANLALLDRLTRTTIRSPVRGIVKQIKITTVGGIAQPGSEIMQIVPVEDTLLVEAQVRPSDIGFIHIGQLAAVKISAYDYSIYGGLRGAVEQISADTITNDKGESFYIIRVRTLKNYLGTKEKPLYIIAGMTSTVDILTGKKSVLDYLLKPILKAKDAALRER